MPGRLFLVATALLCCVLGGASGQPVKIQTFVGETVILPCKIKHSGDQDWLVEWSKDGLRHTNITFLYRQGCEIFGEKHPLFHYRTSLFLEELKDGNLSLRLSDVRRSDAGKYECKRMSRPHLHTSTIELLVGAVSEPRLSVVAGAAVTVLCEASCWFPRPEVSFLDAWENDIVAEKPHIDKDNTSGCFHVSRRATVTAGNSVTCRVHQSKINQTRIAKIHIPDDCMKSCRIITGIAAALFTIVIIGVIGVIAFIYHKCCNSDGERKFPSAQSSQRNSTSSNAERLNLISKVDPVPTATPEHQREVDELKSKLRDRDETIDRQTEELNDFRSKQSPVECHHGQPTIHRNPSTSSRDVSKPTDHPQEQLPQDINPKPAASANTNRPKYVNFSQNKDAKPNASRQSSDPGLQIPGSSHNNDVSPAAHPEGTHGGSWKTKSLSLPRSISAKPQRRATLSESNRYSLLANLPENEQFAQWAHG